MVIGSGFGGSLAAWPLVREGADVLMLERGPWVERGPHNWAPQGTLTQTPHYGEDIRYRATTDRGPGRTSSCSCVGGPSVFYGAVSMRFREGDFRPHPEIVTDSGARWPFDYAELRPSYDEVERILGVSGRRGDDPTEPPAGREYPSEPPELSPVSRAMTEAARARGLSPFRLPLAIDYQGNGRGRACEECATCDTFACRVEAKNDLAVRVLPRLLEAGMELWPETPAVRLQAEGGRVVAVECLDRRTGERRTVTADTFVLGAGALATAHLLLSSGLQALNPAGHAVGRHLTRHCSSIVFGAYPWLPKHEGRFHKQIGINDFYFGDPEGRGPAGKLGNIQQTQTPSMGTVRGEVNPVAAVLLTPLVRRATGLLVIAEDRPRYENRVELHPEERDALGLSRLVIEHRYDPRDLEARKCLEGRAREIHRSAGALATYVHVIDTFSHALGTVRMGDDPERDPLDASGRFRGLDNLFVSDGSALPTAGGVNPSLTIAANALRIGRLLAGVRRAAGLQASPSR